MITRIRRGNDPYSEFVVDDPLTQEEIILSSEEESEVDNLDEVSLDSMPVTGKELHLHSECRITGMSRAVSNV